MDIDLRGRQLLPLEVDDFVGQSVAILGIKGSGKSNTAAVLMEEFLSRGVPICIVDIAGEYHTLKDEFSSVTVIGKSLTCEPDLPLTDIDKLARTAYTNGVPVVLDLSAIPTDARESLLQQYFAAIWEQSAISRIPLIIFLEECHQWIPQRGRTAVSGVFTDIAAEGRKRGLSLIMIGQRSARINKDMLSQADIAFLHRVRHPVDMTVYEGLIPRRRAQVRQMVAKLKTGQALVLMGEQVIQSHIRMRRTEHVGATPTLADIPAQQMSLLDLMMNGGSND